MAQTLSREDPDFDLCLIQPTAVSGRVVDGESIPDVGRHFRTKGIRQRFAAMDIQVVQHQMDRLCFWVCHRQADRHLGEFKARAIRCREGKMAARLRFYSTENIGGPTALIFVIPSRFSSWNRWRDRP
jgi:hypothetical protein